MKHLGDITKIRGYDAPVVDVIVGGSPCQGLSVAGLRKGLADERSGLFMEQIRVIKEMREKDGLRGRTDQFIRPRYGVWENVPGALSSGTPKGGDFAAVLTEFVRVAEPEAPDVDVPEKGWPTSGCLIDEMGKWSVAWRILDGQYWGNAYRTDDGILLKPGTPQRRRRIALVADFGGTSAPKILFERTGLRGDHPQSGAAGQGVAAYAQDRPGADDRPGEMGERGEHGAGRGRQLDGVKVYCLQGNGIDRADTAGCNGKGWKEDTSYTLNTIDRPAVVYRKGTRPHSAEEPQKWEEAEVANTLNAFDTGEIRANELICCTVGNGQVNQSVSVEKAGTLNCMHDQQIVFCPDIAHTLRAKSNCDFREDSETYVCAYIDTTHADDVVAPLQARDHKGGKMVQVQHIVRRLTPMECERLQGFPDGWTDIGDWVDSKGKTHKAADSPRYKALVNSICLPPWKWVLKRLCAHYERDATMASLFDGIGGFPLIWEQLNGKGTCLWASEIEEFPMAVTKRRFGNAE